MSIRLMNRRGGAVHKKGAMMNIDGTARLCIAALPPGLAGQFPEVTGHSVVISRRVVENQKLSSAPVKMLEEVFWKRNRDFLPKIACRNFSSDVGWDVSGRALPISTSP